MLVTFSSKAGADILMLGEHAKPLLALTGKNIETNIPVRGIFTPAELPQAIARLEQAIANETPQKTKTKTTRVHAMRSLYPWGSDNVLFLF